VFLRRAWGGDRVPDYRNGRRAAAERRSRGWSPWHPRRRSAGHGDRPRAAIHPEHDTVARDKKPCDDLVAIGRENRDQATRDQASPCRHIRRARKRDQARVKEGHLFQRVEAGGPKWGLCRQISRPYLDIDRAT